MLTDEQLAELGRIKLGILRIQDAIDRVNHIAAQTGLPLRQVALWPAILMANDISLLVHAHEVVVKENRAAAMERLERFAA
jgi:hypothetical protein